MTNIECNNISEFDDDGMSAIEMIRGGDGLTYKYDLLKTNLLV